ncbi:MAG: group II truncated hemoglobin [Oligoflexia bacterium]|nr:group II truncated hemoglobin [Oligoflexia bacterium]
MDQINYMYSMLGEAKIRKLVDDFYEIMDDERFKIIRDMHPKNISSSNEKLALFLIFRFGGPRTYVEKHGHPRMRMRHFPFPIDDHAKDLWLACMNEALEKSDIDKDNQDLLLLFFVQFAAMMVNR